MVVGVMRIECKTTQRKSFSLTRDMVETIETAARGSDEIPAIIVEFLDQRGEPSHEVAVIPVKILEEIVRWRNGQVQG